VIERQNGMAVSCPCRRKFCSKNLGEFTSEKGLFFLPTHPILDPVIFANPGGTRILGIIEIDWAQVNLGLSEV
jgi:hypothetical protein